MLGCQLPRYRLLDLLFAVWGTVAFLVDLGSDVWSAVRYYKAGDTGWAVLYVGLYVLSSSVLQVLSWGWFWVDWQEWNLGHSEAPEPGNAGSGAVKENAAGGAAADYVECYSVPASLHQTSNGTNYPEDTGQVSSVGTAASVVDAVPEIPDLSDKTPCQPEPATIHGCSGDIPPQDIPTAATLEERAILCCGCTNYSAAATEDQQLVRRFCTSKVILWPSCFTLLHILQLGYPLR